MATDRVPHSAADPPGAPEAGPPAAPVADPYAVAAVAFRADMVRQVAESGVLADPAWLAAFEAVPRHLFVPRYHQPANGPRGFDTLSADDPDPQRRARWLAGAYDDVPLVTHVCRGSPVSSSSQPSLMAAMLDALEVPPRLEDPRPCAVLEIGAGTGYNAALLSHRLGDRRVTTVDVDEGITSDAAAHLAAAGYRPAVVTGDGAAGCACRAPYDRLMATCAVPSIPQAWLHQCNPGAVILAPLASGLVKLRVGERGGRAEGRFLCTPAYFVALRSVPEAARAAAQGDVEARDRAEHGAEREAESEADDGAEPDAVPRIEVQRERSTDTGPSALQNEGFRFVLGLAAGNLEVHWSFDPARRVTGVVLSGPDGSVACADRRGTVLVSGPRDLWAAVEETYDLWQSERRPGRERFGLTVDQDRQWLWLDDPYGDVTWALPSVR